MKYFMIRAFLKFLTIRKKISARGESLIQPEENQGYYNYFSYEAIPENTLQFLVKAYKSAFSEPPWEETWKEEDIREKLKKEIKEDSVLTVMDGGVKDFIAGFCWGGIVNISEIPDRIQYALMLKSSQEHQQEIQLKAKEIGNYLKKKSDKVLFFDEVAVLSQFRSGVDPIRFLFRPGLEMAFESGVKQMVFWTIPESKTLALAIFMGFKPIKTIKIGEEKKIIFLYSPNFGAMLKIVQNLSNEKIRRILTFFSPKK